MEERLPTYNEMWYIINSYYVKYGLVRHQIESFDNFMLFSLPHIVQESNEIKVSQNGEDHYNFNVQPEYTKAYSHRTGRD